VELQVWAKTSVTTRAVRAGEAVAPASMLEEREIRAGHPPFIVPFDAIAVRSLPVGAAVGSLDVARTRVSPGDPIKVVFVAGALAIETMGRRTQCVRSRDCAVLASGKHVEGEIDENGTLVVEVPR
jgi:flagella basal body P-ring formation protein FlgA